MIYLRGDVLPVGVGLHVQLDVLLVDVGAEGALVLLEGLHRLVVLQVGVNLSGERKSNYPYSINSTDKISLMTGRRVHATYSSMYIASTFYSTHLVPEPPEECHVLSGGCDLGELPGEVLSHGSLVGGRVQQDHAHATGHCK